MHEAVIIAAVRSPIGKASKGSLVSIRPDDLASQVVRSAIDAVPQLDPHDIVDLVMGCGQPGGEQGFNIGRMVAMRLGYDFMPGTTITRHCASSLQAARMAFHAIRTGEGDAFIAAGVETVSRFIYGSADSWPDTHDPLYADAENTTRQRVAEVPGEWRDPRELGILPDPYITMLLTAENVARLKGISRREMDEFAVRSQNRAEEATLSGFWAEEITPVVLPDGTVVDRDDCPRPGVTYESVAALEPVLPGGRITAGNACPLNDGAAALIIVSDTKAKELGATPLARIVSTAVTALSPEIMGMGPVASSQAALKSAGLSIADIDLVEMNEAFAAQVIPSVRELGIPDDKINVHGGAIALGHPYGMTGARIATTLIHSLQAADKQFGLETMCVGGGQGMAMVIERLS